MWRKIRRRKKPFLKLPQTLDKIRISLNKDKYKNVNLYYQDESIERTREAIEERMVLYMEQEAREHGTHWYSIARHMLGLRNGLAGARRWRQVWSDHRLKTLPPHEVMKLARTKPAEALVL